MADIPKIIQDKLEEFRRKDPKSEYDAYLVTGRTWKITVNGVCCLIIDDIFSDYIPFHHETIKTQKRSVQPRIANPVISKPKPNPLVIEPKIPYINPNAVLNPNCTNLYVGFRKSNTLVSKKEIESRLKGKKPNKDVVISHMPRHYDWNSGTTIHKTCVKCGRTINSVSRYCFECRKAQNET